MRAKQQSTALARDQIREGVNHSRASLGSVSALKASIAAGGLLTPLSVRKVGKDRFELIAGYRRLASIDALIADGQWKGPIPVTVVVVDDTEALWLNATENAARKNLSLVEQGRLFSRLRLSGATAEQICERLTYSPAHVSQVGRIWDHLAPELQDRYLRGGCPTLTELRQLAKVDHARQIEIADALEQSDQRSQPRKRRRLRSALTVREIATKLRDLPEDPDAELALQVLDWIQGRRKTFPVPLD